MNGPKPISCVAGECVSEFPYRDECALTASGCCAWDVLIAAAKLGDAHYPMDLRPGGNPFVNALERAGLVRVVGDITRAGAGAAA